MGKKSDSISDETNAALESVGVDTKDGVGVERGPTPQVLWSKEMEALARLASNAPKDAPIVESMEELSPRIEMDIPEILKRRYPQHTFRWESLAHPAGLTSFGGHYVPVTRMSHPDLDRALWDDGTGCIVYRGQNFLAFTRRENTEMKQKQVLRQFEMKSDQVLNPNARQYGKKGQVVVEPVADGGGGDGGYILDPTPPDYDADVA